VRQSNLYIILFSAVLTIVIGGVMSSASIILKPAQDKQVELDTKRKILGAVMDISSIKDPNEILKIYNQKVSSIVIDFNGNEVKVDSKGIALEAEKVNIQKNYKFKPEDRVYPVFMFKGDDSGEISAYIFPMFGNGLWDWISGYMAVDKDLNTVKGIAFDHKQETPGLGARITEVNVQNRYVGKRIFSESGQFMSITMVKGEGNSSLSAHQVDGMSGATMTAKGVNSMISNYLKCYDAFINKRKKENNIALNY